MNRIRFTLLVSSVALIPTLVAASPAAGPVTSFSDHSLTTLQEAPRYFVCVKLTSRIPLESPNARVYPQNVTPYGSEVDVDNIWLHQVLPSSVDILLSDQTVSDPSPVTARRIAAASTAIPYRLLAFEGAIIRATTAEMKAAELLGLTSNMRAEAVPEPASFIPVALGGLLVLRRRRPAKAR
jgi:hypothetical protein